MTTDTPSSPNGTRVDVRDMIVVHTAMLREFRLVPAAVRRVPGGDHKWADRVARHVTFLCDLLHHHHQGEDDLLWPTLRERTGPAAHQVIDEVEDQHASIDAALTRVATLRSDWVAAPTAQHRALLADGLDALHLVLRDHLDLEERVLLPLAATALTAPEWHAVGAAGASSIPRPDMPLVIGMFAYEADPAVVRTMLTAAPLPVRILMPRIGPSVYARRARLIHGTPTP